ncbi:hypothetical protein BLOT_000808 [Blomia tropicalis]|nr:hypothetical protein BLOT_000808 [Blomia tropicalis]
MEFDNMRQHYCHDLIQGEQIFISNMGQCSFVSIDQLVKGQRILNITNYTATKIDASLMELGGYLYDVEALMLGGAEESSNGPYCFTHNCRIVSVHHENSDQSIRNGHCPSMLPQLRSTESEIKQSDDEGVQSSSTRFQR